MSIFFAEMEAVEGRMARKPPCFSEVGIQKDFVVPPPPPLLPLRIAKHSI